MRILAFDCSTIMGSIAVVEDEAVIFAETFENPRGRGGPFFDILERAIKDIGRPTRIAVGIGPGSYNGLRMAIAAAEGLKLAMNVELIGIASVRAMPCDEEEYIVVNDARGGVFYCVQIRKRKLVEEFELLSGEMLVAKLALSPKLPVFGAAPIAIVPQAKVAFPDATVLSALALQECPANELIEPLYLKPAHITQPKRAGVLLRGE